MITEHSIEAAQISNALADARDLILPIVRALRRVVLDRRFGRYLVLGPSESKDAALTFRFSQKIGGFGSAKATFERWLSRD